MIHVHFVPGADVHDFEISIKVHTISESINCLVQITETGRTHQ